jgi:hypothetical protein
MSKSKTPRRQAELRKLKAEHDLTYPELAAITGYHWIVLTQWATGGKPLKERTLRSIRLMIAEHAKNHPTTAA